VDQVALDPSGFWGAAQRRNGEVTIPHAEHWLARTGALANFLPGSERRGERFSDSDVYKVLEAMAWEAGRTGDAGLRGRLEAAVAIVAAAVEPDGYLNTYWGAAAGRQRYADLGHGHELYCHGHLIQAGVAAARSGGPDALIALARAVGDHVSREFGPAGPRPSLDGHP